MHLNHLVSDDWVFFDFVIAAVSVLMHTCQVYRFGRESPDFRHACNWVFYLSSFSRFNKKSPPKIPTRRFAATSNIKT